jgi:hypothetical protein
MRSVDVTELKTVVSVAELLTEGVAVNSISWPEGWPVGWSVGWPVGWLVGSSLGSLVILCDEVLGFLVGLADVLGLMEGACVMSGPPPPS